MMIQHCFFSDSPETVEKDGILYQDTVKGNARLLYYHVNGTKQDKKIAVVIKICQISQIKLW